MLILKPKIDRTFNRMFVLQTFTRWHFGVANAVYAEAWLKETGPLEPAESAALEKLRLKLIEGDGCAMMRRVARGLPPDDAWAEAERILGHRADRILDAAEEALEIVRRRLQEPPAWFAEMNRRVDALFGISEEHPLEVWLLPSPKGWTGGTGNMLVGEGAITLECSGNPGWYEAELFITVLHEAMHAIHQEIALIPIVDRMLTEPAGRELAARYANSPPDRIGVSASDTIGEFAVHSILDVLRRDAGLGETEPFWRQIGEEAEAYFADPHAGWPDGRIYDAWVLNGARPMIKPAEDYVRSGRPIDEAFVETSLRVIRDTIDRYERAAS